MGIHHKRGLAKLSTPSEPRFSADGVIRWVEFAQEGERRRVRRLFYARLGLMSSSSEARGGDTPGGSCCRPERTGKRFGCCGGWSSWCCARERRCFEALRPFPEALRLRCVGYLLRCRGFVLDVLHVTRSAGPRPCVTERVDLGQRRKKIGPIRTHEGLALVATMRH